MADGSIPPPTALYPQPPQQQPSALLSDPSRLLGVVQQLNEIKKFQAHQAVGRALQDAVGPDGVTDPAAAASGIKAAGAMAAPGAMEGLQGTQALQGQQIANSRALQEKSFSQNDYFQKQFSGWQGYGGGVPDNVVNDTFVNGARMSGINTAMLDGERQRVLAMSPKQRIDYARRMAITQAGPQFGAEPVEGGIITQGPNTGARPLVPRAGLVQGQGAGGQGAGPPISALPPGQAEAIKANQEEFVGDQTRSANTLANLRQLQSAYGLAKNLDHLSFGPGSSELSKAGGFASFLGLPVPTDKVSARQVLNKYLMTYALSAPSSGRSDQGLSASVAANPNMELTQGANLELIRSRMAMDRQDAALPLAAPADRQQYKTFKSGYYQKTDPRAFAFDLMSPSERAELKKSLGDPKSEAYRKFIESYNLAKQAGMLSAPGQ